MPYVNSTSNNDSVSSTTIAAAAQNHIGGNAIVVLTNNYTSPQRIITNITDTAGNIYNACGSVVHLDSSNTLEIWAAFNIQGNAANVVTVTFDAAADFRAIGVAQFSGWKTAGAYHASSTGTITAASGTTHTSSEVSTSAPTDVVGLFTAWDIAFTLSHGVNTALLTQVVGGDFGLGGRDGVQAGSYALSMTTASSTRYGMLIAAFELAPIAARLKPRSHPALYDPPIDTRTLLDVRNWV
jgi:hypothetical protein